MSRNERYFDVCYNLAARQPKAENGKAAAAAAPVVIH